MLCDSLNADLKPKHGLELWFPLSLQDSGSCLKQNDDPDKNLSIVGWCICWTHHGSLRRSLSPDHL